MIMSTAIRMENIVKTYGETRVLNGLSLSIEEGTFLTVVGSSGCGKTTLLKMINGLIKPDSGKIMVKGQDLEQADLISLRRSIGYSIQGSILFPHMSVEENIAYVPNLLNGKDKEKTEAAVRKWMKIVSLDDRLRTRYPDELSGGQQQRVGIARALASSPDILLMDEPFGAVDSITRSQLQSEIKNIHDQTGITVVFITHDLREALYLGTRVLILDQGEIRQLDTPRNILSHPADDFVRSLIANSFHDLNALKNERSVQQWPIVNNGSISSRPYWPKIPDMPISPFPLMNRRKAICCAA